MSPVGNQWHLVHKTCGCLKSWLISFNFDRFRAPGGPVIFFVENLPMGCDKTYNPSSVLHTIWINPECHQTTHLWFCGAPAEWPQNSRISCSYARSKSWKSLIYHHMSPLRIPRHSLHGSHGRLKLWLIAFNFERFRDPSDPIIFLSKTFLWSAKQIIMHSRCFAPTKLPQNVYYFVMQPRNTPETVVKIVFRPVQSRGSPSIPCPLDASHDIRCTKVVDV